MDICTKYGSKIKMKVSHMKGTGILKNPRLRLLILPGLGLIIALIIILDNLNLFTGGHSVTFTYIQNFTKGRLGYGNVSNYHNELPLSKLEPGDILLGGWPDCAYGEFSHAALYLGNGKVLEGYVDQGITINSADHFRNYSRACILRVKAGENVKRRVIAYALKQRGKIFYPIAFKSGNSYWNCSKIIWKAFFRENINLDVANDLWVAPEAFLKSPRVSIIGLKGEINDYQAHN